MNDLDGCYRSALRILNHRFNSAAELKRKLRAKGFDRECIEPTIVRLTDEKWLDDARYAGAYVRTRLQKRIGKLRVRRELIAAGVADDIIDQALGENVDSDAERSRAMAAAEKRLPILVRRYGSQLARNKLTAYLLKQGYDSALVREIVKEMTSLSPRA